MKRKALFVGVNSYQDEHISDLRCCVQDASALFGRFQAIGFDSHLLTNPTEADLKKEIVAFTKDLGPGDSFLFYFAGHGFSQTESGDQLLAVSDSLLEDLEINASGIKFNYLNQRTTKGGFNRAFILDACRSEIRHGVRGPGIRDLVPLGKLTPACMNEGASYFVIRSCQQGQYAHEIESARQGLFSLAFIDVLKRAKTSGRQLAFDDGFRIAITARMKELACQYGIRQEQTPEGTLTGVKSLVIIDGRMDSMPDPAPVQPDPPPVQSDLAQEDPVPDGLVVMLPIMVVDTYKHLLFKCQQERMNGLLDAMGSLDETESMWRVTDVAAFIEFMEGMPHFYKIARQHRAEHLRLELENWFKNHLPLVRSTCDEGTLRVLNAILESITERKAKR